MFSAAKMAQLGNLQNIDPTNTHFFGMKWHFWRMNGKQLFTNHLINACTSFTECNNQTTAKTGRLQQGCINLPGIDKRIVLGPERLKYGLTQRGGG
ncbi:MAG TPA: hypothetical protein VK168_01955, partial [Saprospiraceae bacterium]|nr:hypothetical protein [Saprospiraceae bacterium]